MITSEILQKLQQIIAQSSQEQKSVLVEFNGESDPVHLLVDLAPDNNISEFVKIIKATSSRLIRKEFAEHINKFYRKPVFWSSSYFVNSSGGVSLDVLKKYIKQQIVPNPTDKTRAFIPQCNEVKLGDESTEELKGQ